MLTPIPENTEQFEYVIPTFEKKVESEQTSSDSTSLSLGSPTQVAIIIGVSLPCILIIYFLFKPTKITMQKNTNDSSPTQKPKRKKKQKKKIRHLKGSDYYELDGDFFN